jgi:hypothetical protein
MPKQWGSKDMSLWKRQLHLGLKVAIAEDGVQKFLDDKVDELFKLWPGDEQLEHEAHPLFLNRDKSMPLTEEQNNAISDLRRNRRVVSIFLLFYLD